MTTIILIAANGPDRVGLVAAVTGRLYDLGLNLGDTTFAVLGTGYEFRSIADLPAGVNPSQLLTELRAVPELAASSVEVQAFGHRADRALSGRSTHRIRLTGGDQPGLIARITEAFVEFGANIVRLNAERAPGANRNTYVTDFEVAIPAARTDACLATVANTAGELQLACTVEAAPAR